MRETSCPLKKSWKLRWRSARSVVAHLGGDGGFKPVTSTPAEFRSSVTPLEPFHIFRMTATGVKVTGPRLFTFCPDFHSSDT